MRLIRSIGMAAIMGLSVMGSGCGGACDTICGDAVDCEEDALSAYLEIVDSDEEVIGCGWDDPEDVRDRCIDACESEYDKLSSKEAESVDACIDCMQQEAGESCGDLLDAADHGCDDECDDDEDVEEFFKELFHEWDLDDGDFDC